MSEDAGRIADGVELFRSANLLARGVGLGRGDVCVVTFACLLDPPSLEAPGFGEAFFRDRGIAAVHVTCADNAWYQYPELFAALDAVRAAVRPFRRVLAYGSSMGGYAAVRFGARAGAQDALAISPQFSVDARRVPFERRWRHEARRIRFMHEDAPPDVAAATVVYDPCREDARHADLIAASAPVRRLRLVHAGHPAGAYLAEAGLLPELVLFACAGVVPDEYGRRARAARRRSGQYLFTLARRTPRRRGGTKLALARLAVEAAPAEAVYRSYLALLLDASGDPAGAEAAHRAAAALAPGSAMVLGRFARFLLRRGVAREGAALARAASELTPRPLARDRHLGCAALLAEGRVREAVSAAAGTLAPGLLGDAVRVLLWRPAEPGWRGRLAPARADRLALHLGTPDELRSADPPRPAHRA